MAQIVFFWWTYHLSSTHFVGESARAVKWNVRTSPGEFRWQRTSRSNTWVTSICRFDSHWGGRFGQFHICQNLPNKTSESDKFSSITNISNMRLDLVCSTSWNELLWHKAAGDQPEYMWIHVNFLWRLSLSIYLLEAIRRKVVIMFNLRPNWIHSDLQMKGIS